MPYFDFAVIGGDKRLSYMIPNLRKRGFRVSSYKTSENTDEEKKANSSAKQTASLREAVSDSAAVILGIPICKNNFLNMPGNIPMIEFVGHLKENQPVFGGNISIQDKEVMFAKTKRIYDFLQDERIASFNAMATSEGVILELIKRRETVLSGQRTLLFGFGRCGKNIALRLIGMQAKVLVATDNTEEQILAEVLGFQVVSLSEAKKRIGQMDLLINTIPFPFLEKEIFQRCRKEIPLYEVASRSCLVDEETSKDTSLQLIYLPGLPGKYAARSLAEVYTEFVSEKWRGENEQWN